MKSTARNLRFSAVAALALGCGMLACTANAQVSAPITINVPAEQPSIQAAINVSSDGDTILVAPGTYYENIDFLGKDITVTTSAGAATTILDGSKGNAPAVYMAPENAKHATSTPPPMVLNGFTIRGGGAEPATSPTGGIFVSEGGPFITNNIITHNHCAGIYLSFSQAVVQGNEIDNTLDNGGDCGGTASADGSALFYTNYPFSGSANNAPVTSIIGNTIQNNVQAGQETSRTPVGAAITMPLYAVIQSNIVSNNKTAGTGGAIFASSGSEVVQNLIYGNTASCAAGLSLGASASLPSTLRVTRSIATQSPIQIAPRARCTTLPERLHPTTSSPAIRRRR